MKLSNFSLCAVVSLALLAGTARAQYVEQGDAGQTVATAQATGPAGGPLFSITGSLSSSTDADLYRIFLQNPAQFSATTVNGVTSVDTQLFLFTMSGRPVYMNDNTALTLQSNLPANHMLGPQGAGFGAGFYLLGIAPAGFNPADFNNVLLFAEPPLGDDTAVRGPNGNTINPLAQWSATSPQPGGAYRIDLTGTLVPEPSTWALLTIAGLGAGIQALRRRKKLSH